MSKDIAIGIDLGTTYSCVAVWQNDRVEIIPNDQGNRTTPSYVSFDNDLMLVGDAAKNQAHGNPHKTLYDIKRIIGKKYNDCDLRTYPFTVKSTASSLPLISVDDERTMLPEEISALVLSYLKKTAEDHLGREVRKAVITVPAYFNDKQRNATKVAGQIAELEVMRIINEPTAAAVAYGLDRKSKKSKNILIYDLGGGTFDVTILNLDEGIFTVMATTGNTHLGGEDVDDRLVSHLISKHNLPISQNARSLRRLRNACEKAKRSLSVATSTQIEVESLYDGEDFLSTITRAKLEELCNDLFQKTLKSVENALRDSTLTKRDIDDIVLVGGSTRIPRIQQLLSEYFGGKTLTKSINPDEAVAYGAAVSAFVLSGGKSGKTNNMLLVDVCPLSIGVETAGGVMDIIVKRNTKIPLKRTKTFTTYEDNQTKITVDIFEGERAKTIDCHKLGSFELNGITPKKAGEIHIDVEINIDANSIMQVKASEKESDISHTITVTNDDALTPKEIEKMIQDGEKYKRDDIRMREKMDHRTDLEGICLDALENDDVKKKEIATEILEWLEKNPNASVEEYKSKLSLIERLLYGITRKFRYGSC